MNKLGEYMVAKAGRRRTIVSDQKHPKDFIVARYTAVYDAIARCLSAGGDPLIIREAMEDIYQATPKNMWQQQDLALSAEALDLFLNLIDEIDLRKFSVSRSAEGAPPMNIAGVAVSVRPELYLRVAGSNGLAGAVKLYVSKRGPLADDAALYVGTVLHQYMNEVLTPVVKIEAKNCMVIDILAQRVYTAPTSFKQRRKDILAACEEIVRAWPAA